MNLTMSFLIHILVEAGLKKNSLHNDILLVYNIVQRMHE